MVAFTLCYSVPQAMITAELSTAFPDNGGYSLWVQAAFGDFWGLQESYAAPMSDTRLRPTDAPSASVGCCSRAHLHAL
eukprot:5647378-Prymnesium_polylepis.1